MKRLHNPNAKALRQSQYDKRTKTFLKAVAHMAMTLQANGIDIGQKMQDELAARQSIKDTFKDTP